MARTPQDVTEAELAVLQHLWECDGATLRELADALYPGGTNSDYATAQKLCERLAAKGFVEVDRSARPRRLRASVGRDDLIRRRLKTVADKLCEGSYMPLISHLMEGGALKDSELRALRERLTRLDGDRTGGDQNDARTPPSTDDGSRP